MCISVSLVAVDGKGEEILLLLIFFLPEGGWHARLGVGVEELVVSSKVIRAVCSTLGSSDCVVIFSPPFVWGATCGLKFRKGSISATSECGLPRRTLSGVSVATGMNTGM